MNFMLTIVFNVLFDLSLRNNLFSWVGIYLMKNRKCAPAARWLQHKKGGKILYSVKEEWNDGKIKKSGRSLGGAGGFRTGTAEPQRRICLRQ